MAQNNKGEKSEGLCEKIHNAVSPFRSRTRRISHQPQGSVSITSDKKPLSQTAENPVRISPPQTKPVHVLPQPSLNKMIPVEFNHFSAQNSKKLVALAPVVQSAARENSTRKPVQEFGEREILIVRGQKFAKSASRKQELAPIEKIENVAPSAKDKSKDDETIHEGKFSDYINKVKNRMIKTASNIGGGGGGRISPRRDSFNDKVTNYINHTKIKIRTTTAVGVEKSPSLE